MQQLIPKTAEPGSGMRARKRSEQQKIVPKLTTDVVEDIVVSTPRMSSRGMAATPREFHRIPRMAYTFNNLVAHEV